MYLGYIKNAIYSDSHNFPYSGFTCKKKNCIIMKQ